jgi:hemolysin III
MRHTKWVFAVLDKCAIYILIAGSYTPFLQIVLAHNPVWSTGLLAFLWILCAMGVGVEFLFPTWQKKGRFSLAMYLGMGWSALVCLPEVARTLDQNAINLMTLGGVAYTAGVPFFVRDNSTLVCLRVCVCCWKRVGVYSGVSPKFCFALVAL